MAAATTSRNFMAGFSLRMSRGLIRDDGTIDKLNESAEGVATSVLTTFERWGGENLALIEPYARIRTDPTRMYVDLIATKAPANDALQWRVDQFSGPRFYNNIVEAVVVAADLWKTSRHSLEVIADQNSVNTRSV